MNILGIDTSFDDTAASVVSGNTILSNVLSSQLPMYQQWGGVVPRLARENHEKNIDAVIALALKRANVSWKEIDAIAVTQGPGLAITLEVGIDAAKRLAAEYKKPIVAVNHLEGHLLSFLAQPKHKKSILDHSKIFPALAIIVSGGNTQFVLTRAIGNYEIVGETQDDALGEAYDKVGRMLGLGYPAGGLVEKLALKGIPGSVVFPIPMLGVKNANTSYSGLKTAAIRIIDEIKSRNEGQLDKQDIANIALGFQTAAIKHLTKKLEFALNEREVQSLFLGGGVACNNYLRTQIRRVAQEHGLKLYLPYAKKLCVDNAAMIALVGNYKAGEGKFIDPIKLDRVPNARLGS